ncbi:hypothetical protein GOBAR_AA27966 [Gossypium barbadense]|uniref:Uncharacterized protein n=1 Tax=Gossypium barbadense TaxID=3634 RepID=A0A2P5WNN4_GOSBA|nr:hypothetical protein GOBAR_AA27966 [Gossypium barbadense]
MILEDRFDLDHYFVGVEGERQGLVEDGQTVGDMEMKLAVTGSGLWELILGTGEAVEIERLEFAKVWPFGFGLWLYGTIL